MKKRIRRLRNCRGGDVAKTREINNGAVAERKGSAAWRKKLKTTARKIEWQSGAG